QIPERNVPEGGNQFHDSRFPIQISHPSTIVSNARNAKRRYHAGARKMRKNFSVAALFQNNTSLPEWMFRVSSVARAQTAHGRSATVRPRVGSYAAPVHDLCCCEA